MGKINNPHPAKQGKHISVPTVEIQHFEHPIFCYRYLHKDYGLDQCDPDEKRSLMERFVKLSQMTWNEIGKAHRHGLGHENIRIDQLRATCPTIITEDVKHLLAFRFQGMKPFLGHRNRFIFHVLFIDRNFTLYGH